MKILFVCLGNICRSPVLEGFARAAASSRGLAWTLDSAGTGGWHAGEPPDPRAIASARRHGVDIAGLRARQVAADDFARFDWLLCADAANLAALRARAPAHARDRIALVLDVAGVLSGGEVPDPYYGDVRDFDAVSALAAQAAAGLLRRFAPGA